MKTVYLYGPITGLSYAGAQDWRTWMRAQLEPHGIDAVSPLRFKDYLANLSSISGHGREYLHMGVLSTPPAVIARDKFDVLRADMLVGNFLGADRVSIGSMFEQAWAHQKHTPIAVAMEPGIPIASSEHLAWLAGLIDGEGCVSIGRSQRGDSKSPTYQPQVIVKMTNEAILRMAHARTGLGNVTGPLHQPLANRKPFWTWIVSNSNAVTLLTQISPWLIVKRQQAAIAVEMQRLNGLSNGGRGGTPPELIAEKARIFDLYKRAQAGEVVDAPDLHSDVSAHAHMFVTSTIGFRVESLEALRDVVVAVLG